MRASWINVIAMLFHELTAINVVLAYSTNILEDIFGKDTDASQGFTAREGTYVIGLTNFCSSALSIITMSFMGRRPLLLFGHAGICITYIIMGFFTYYKVNIGVLVMMCVFLLIY